MTYADLTNEQLILLHWAIFPFTEGRKMKVLRVTNLTPDSNYIETKCYLGTKVLWYISDGSIEVVTDLSFNPFGLVKKAQEFGINYEKKPTKKSKK